MNKLIKELQSIEMMAIMNKNNYDIEEMLNLWDENNKEAQKKLNKEETKKVNDYFNYLWEGEYENMSYKKIKGANNE